MRRKGETSRKDTKAQRGEGKEREILRLRAFVLASLSRILREGAKWAKSGCGNCFCIEADFGLWKRTKMEWSMSSLARRGQSIGFVVGCLSLWGGIMGVAGAQTPPPPASPKTAETTKPVASPPAKPGAVMQLKMELTGEFAYRLLLPNAKELPAPTPLPASTGGVIALPDRKSVV